MNVGKGIIAFFAISGVIMVLVSRELEDRGGEIGSAASTFTLIGMIWTGVAILLVIVFALVGRSTARAAEKQTEMLRDLKDSDG